MTAVALLATGIVTLGQNYEPALPQSFKPIAPKPHHQASIIRIQHAAPTIKHSAPKTQQSQLAQYFKKIFSLDGRRGICWGINQVAYSECRPHCGSIVWEFSHR